MCFVAEGMSANLTTIVPGLVVNAGRMEYSPAWDLQKALVEQRRADRISDVLLLLEHPPVYTIGRQGKSNNLLAPAERLTALGAEVVSIDRGGDVTFHGPGQLVGYPILDLRPRGMLPVRYVRALEEALIAALGDLSVEATRREGFTGVWTQRGKVAAIGVRIARGITSHGFALNVTTDLSWFGHIVPCGLTEPVTSLAELLPAPPPWGAVCAAVTTRMGERFGVEWREVSLDQLRSLV